MELRLVILAFRIKAIATQTRFLLLSGFTPTAAVIVVLTFN
jgi:hypothetical protein